MKTITISDFNKLPDGLKIKVLDSDVTTKTIDGRVSSVQALKNKFIQLSNGDEVIAFEIRKFQVLEGDEKGTTYQLQSD